MKSVPRTPVWLWLNLLSLDAPLVAIIWQDFLERCFPSVLRPAGRLTLGLTVWAIYLADRLIDTRYPAQPDERSRHHFYRIHRRAATVLLTAVAAVDALIATLWLRPAVLSTGLWVAAAVLTYLGLFAQLRIEFQQSKRLCAATLFTAGVFLVAWTSTPHALTALTPPALAFCALCFYNLFLVDDSTQPHWPARAAWCVFPLVWGAFWLGDSRWYAAVALSATGLAGLHLARGNFSADARYILADAVLLTPLVL